MADCWQTELSRPEKSLRPGSLPPSDPLKSGQLMPRLVNGESPCWSTSPVSTDSAPHEYRSEQDIVLDMKPGYSWQVGY